MSKRTEAKRPREERGESCSSKGTMMKQAEELRQYFSQHIHGLLFQVHQKTHNLNHIPLVPSPILLLLLADLLFCLLNKKVFYPKSLEKAKMNSLIHQNFATSLSSSASSQLGQNKFTEIRVLFVDGKVVGL